MAAIGDALKALSEDPSISAPDIKSIQQAITLVVLPEPNGNRFSRLSTVCDQPSNLAVEADSVEIGLESNRVMEIGVNSWSVETVVVVNDGDDGLVEVTDDSAQETIHEALEEEAANKETKDASKMQQEMSLNTLGSTIRRTNSKNK